MLAIHRKLLRDLGASKGQALAISLVIASGIAMFITYLGTFDSLRLTQQTYYDRYRFADVFANVKRAPLSLRDDLLSIPGVNEVETRVVFDVNLDMGDEEEPATGRLISIPEVDRSTLNDVLLLRGRYIEPDRPDEVLVSEGFALAHGLVPGDKVVAVINGRLRQLRVVGIGLSPEYVYTIRPGEIVPDDKRFGLFWIGRKALANAFRMEGGFNDLSLKLSRGANQAAVIDRVDRILKPYGGLGAIPRSRQLSHWYLDNELKGLQGAGLVLPIIFLAVAAFLLNVALSRIVAVQREQIAALKALGYSNFQIGVHYTFWGLTLSMFGGLVGVLGGAWLGSKMLAMYNDFFRFPFLAYHLSPAVILGAVGFSAVAGLLGAWRAARQAVILPPAEAMRPEPPANFKVGILERMGLRTFLTPPMRMIIRNLGRNPGRTLSSVVGIAAAASIYVAGLFMMDSVDEMMDLQFNLSQRFDLQVSFVEPAPSATRYALQPQPGVLAVEPLRSVPVRLRNGHVNRQASITGLSQASRLHRIVDNDYRIIELPSEGLVLSTQLAQLLGLKVGQKVRMEVLEGSRPVREEVVTGLVDEMMGATAYMNFETLGRLLGEGPRLSGAYLAVDPAAAVDLYRRLKRLPVVAAVTLKKAIVENFNKTLAENIGIMIFFNTMFAAIISFGVVYNAARISMSERSRELASLRVMGFTRFEISAILLGELAVVVVLALPLGMVFGYGFASLIVNSFSSELYRLPLLISARTYGGAILTVLISATVSGLLVRRKLDHLDLVEVLKTRE